MFSFVIDISKLKRAAGRKSCFVEVGHGEIPAFALLRKVPLEDELYLGLDIKDDAWRRDLLDYDLNYGRRQIDSMRRSGSACYHASIGTEGSLPFPDSSVDTVFMQMITNDRLIGRGVVLRLISESARVLREGGALAFFNAPPGWRLPETGDVIVDFIGKAFGMVDYSDRWGKPVEVPELSASFQPLPIEGHAGFLEQYSDGPGRFVPGKNYSVFIRK